MYRRDYKKEAEIKELFSTRTGGKMYKLFYEGRSYRQKEGGEILLTKFQVIEMLGLDYYGNDSRFSYIIDQYWNRAITVFQKRAIDMMQPWGTIRIMHKNGKKIWLHGYTTDPAKQEAMSNYKHAVSVGTYKAELKQRNVFQVVSGVEVSQQNKLDIGMEYSFEE